AVEAAGHRARTIDVDYASHGPQVDQITDELHRLLAGIQPATTDVAFYSTVTAGPVDTTELDTHYWVTNLREQVRFSDTVQALLTDGHRLFIEASPHPGLAVGLQETFEQTGVAAVAVPTLRRGEGGRAQLVRALGRAFVAGAPVDWSTWFPAASRHTVDLPTYAFQRQRYWLTPGGDAGDVAAAGLRPVEHALLSAALSRPDGEVVLTGRLSSRTHPWSSGHLVGTALVPDAALVEWALRAADESGCAVVEELERHRPLALPASGDVRVQVSVAAADASGRRAVRIHCRADDGAPDGGGPGWVHHASAVVGPAAEGTPLADPGPWPPPDARPVDVDDWYAASAGRGQEYGPVSRGVRAMWRAGADLLAEVELPDAADGAPGAFGIHPALLDAALHPALPEDDSPAGDRVWLPHTWRQVALWAGEATTLRVRLTPLQDEDDAGDGARAVRVLVADGVGAPVLTAASMTLGPVETEPYRVREASAPVRPRAPAAVRRGAAGRQVQNWAEQAAALPPQERQEAALELVLAQAAAVLGRTDPDRIPTERGFLELGFDSLTALELRNRLAEAAGLQLPATVVFDHPNATDLARHLCDALAPPARSGARTLSAALEELSVLTDAMVPLARDPAAAAELRRRLRTASDRLATRATRGAPGAAGADGPDAPSSAAAPDLTSGLVTRIDTAPAGEIFEFIDGVLGRKGGPRQLTDADSGGTQ
ncbi:acyltransferase domain-containing protein, partial [Streptomyces sp. NPDC047315]|uniref:acyltransferase domain-containing protein n=1 Tax=Streptomyces sp. NPDC047315 TaxID=3155142 RepID=UPI0033E13FE2